MEYVYILAVSSVACLLIWHICAFIWRIVRPIFLAIRWVFLAIRRALRTTGAAISALYRRCEAWIKAIMCWSLLLGMLAGLVTAIAQRNWPVVMEFLRSSPMVIVLIALAYGASPYRLEFAPSTAIAEPAGSRRYSRRFRLVARAATP